MSRRDRPDWYKAIGGSTSLPSVKERRSLIRNHGCIRCGYDGDAWPAICPVCGVELPTRDMESGNLTYYRGKFYPRGCRGFITQVEMYIDNTGGALRNLTLFMSPHPEMGPVYESTVGVAAGLAPGWYARSVNMMWNYDSLFIWVHGDNNTWWTIGYDTGTPYDAYYGVWWYALSHEDRRYWIRVTFKGETAGDVPISGTINIIEIPSLATGRQVQTLAVPAASTLYDLEYRGAGELLWIMWGVQDDNARNNLSPRLLIDGNPMFPMIVNMNTIHTQYIHEGHGEGIVFSKWDATLHFYSITMELPVPFRTRFQVGFTNFDPAVARSGDVSYMWKRIT